MGDWRIADGILPSPVVRQRISTAICTARDFCPWMRSALDRLMADAKRGKLDVVAVWRFDRFARSSHLLRALEEFAALGVDFVSLRESIDTSVGDGTRGESGLHLFRGDFKW